MEAVSVWVVVKKSFQSQTSDDKDSLSELDDREANEWAWEKGQELIPLNTSYALLLLLVLHISFVLSASTESPATVQDMFRRKKVT